MSNDWPRVYSSADGTESIRFDGPNVNGVWTRCDVVPKIVGDEWTRGTACLLETGWTFKVVQGATLEQLGITRETAKMPEGWERVNPLAEDITIQLRRDVARSTSAWQHLCNKAADEISKLRDELGPAEIGCAQYFDKAENLKARLAAVEKERDELLGKLANEVVAREDAESKVLRAKQVKIVYDSSNCDCYGGCSSCRLPEPIYTRIRYFTCSDIHGLASDFMQKAPNGTAEQFAQWVEDAVWDGSSQKCVACKECIGTVPLCEKCYQIESFDSGYKAGYHARQQDLAMHAFVRGKLDQYNDAVGVAGTNGDPVPGEVNWNRRPKTE